MYKKLILLFTMLLIAFNLNASPTVIYGEDNRIDPILSSNTMHRELARSTAAMIPNRNLLINDGNVIVGGASLEQRGICKKERFSQQLTAANCSGFIVGPKTLVTAGHCIRSMRDCTGSKWVFDYQVESEDQQWAMVPRSSVYSCKKIVRTVLDSRTKDDWAVLELDRAVTDRRILEYRKAGRPAKNAPLVVIGHPTGLPTKIADGANVRIRYDKYFTANLDTYGGNSGSAVFNAETGVVEGILVRGATDYVYDRQLKCKVSNRLPNNGGRGEDVTYITNIPFLK